MTDVPTAAPPTVERSGAARTARLALAAAVASLWLLVLAPAATAQVEGEEAFSDEVATQGATQLCVASGDQEECVEFAGGVTGVLDVVVEGAAQAADVAVDSCPGDGTGLVVALSGADSDASVVASLAGQAQQNGDTEAIDETVGPVQAGADGEATVSVCGAGDGGQDLPGGELPEDPEDLPGDQLPVDPGDGGLGGLLDALQMILDMLGLGDLVPGDLPLGPGDAPDDLPQDPGELPDGELPLNPDDVPGEELPHEPGDLPLDDMPEAPDGDMPDAPDGDMPDGEAPGDADGGASGEFGFDSNGNVDANVEADANGGSEGDDVDVEAPDGLPTEAFGDLF